MSGLEEAPRLPLQLAIDRRNAPPSPPVADGDIRAGHRHQLRERFMRAGTAALSDIELLELVIFRAMPQRDAKAMAQQLLDTFGDFNHVISAPNRQLEEISGIELSVVQELKIVEATAHRLAQAKIIERPVVSSWNDLLTYCRIAMAHLPTEQFRILFLDRKNVLIADEPQQCGTVDHVPVYPREVVKRALELNASAIILVHNHPSGDPTPSDVDITMTRKIMAALETVSITLHDHLVVGKSKEYSFKAQGLI